eukprot:scaffold76715_cov26-Tisochrysis_lutea.AAC.1
MGEYQNSAKYTARNGKIYTPCAVFRPILSARRSQRLPQPPSSLPQSPQQQSLEWSGRSERAGRAQQRRLRRPSP